MGSYVERFWNILGQTTVPGTVDTDASQSHSDEKNQKEDVTIKESTQSPVPAIIEEEEEKFFDLEEHVEEDNKDYSYLRIHTPYSVAKARLMYYTHPSNYISLEGPGMVKDVIMKPSEGYKFVNSVAIVTSLAYMTYAAPVVLLGTALPVVTAYAYNAYKGEEGIQAFTAKSAIGMTAYASSMTATFFVSPMVGMGIGMLATQDFSQNMTHKAIKLTTGYDAQNLTLWSAPVIAYTSHISADAMEKTIDPEPGSWFSFQGFGNNMSNAAKHTSVATLRGTSSLTSRHFFGRFESTAQGITNAFESTVTFPVSLYAFYKTSAEQSEILNNEIVVKAKAEAKGVDEIIDEFEVMDEEFFDCEAPEKEKLSGVTNAEEDEELLDFITIKDPEPKPISSINLPTPTESRFTQKVLDQRAPIKPNEKDVRSVSR